MYVGARDRGRLGRQRAAIAGPRGAPSPRERIDRAAAARAQVLKEPDRTRQASECRARLLTAHLAPRPHRAELGDRTSGDRDHEPLAGLGAPQHARTVIAQLTLGNRVHPANVAVLLRPARSIYDDDAVLGAAITASPVRGRCFQPERTPLIALTVDSMITRYISWR